MRCGKKAILLTLLFATACSDTVLASSPGSGMSPPPEAFTACEDKDVGDRAKFNNRQGQSVSGICEERNGRLILRPDHLRGRGGIPPAAYTACAGKKIGEVVKVVLANERTISGRCEQDGERLFLRPDRAAEKGKDTHSKNMSDERQAQEKPATQLK